MVNSFSNFNDDHADGRVPEIRVLERCIARMDVIALQDSGSGPNTP